MCVGTAHTALPARPAVGGPDAQGLHPHQDSRMAPAPGGGGKGSQAQASPTQSQTMNSLHPDSVSPGRGQGRSSHK